MTETDSSMDSARKLPLTLRDSLGSEKEEINTEVKKKQDLYEKIIKN